MEQRALTRVSIGVSILQADDVEAFLTGHFDSSPVRMETPTGDQAVLDLYFDDPTEAQVAGAVIQAARPEATVNVAPVAAKDWTEAWKDHFHPQQVGQRLWVRAPWHPEAEGIVDPVTLTINPGLSFGTGNHFTTRFCLEWVERLAGEAPGEPMLDLGTGSAILSIAAAKLGYGPVVGIDHDEMALDAAQDNVRDNDVASGVTLELMDLARQWPEGTWPIVFANIYDPLLIEWAPRFYSRTSDWLVLSGIRAQYLDAVAGAYEALGAEEVSRDGDQEWAGLVVRKRGA